MLYVYNNINIVEYINIYDVRQWHDTAIAFLLLPSSGDRLYIFTKNYHSFTEKFIFWYFN